MAKRGDQARESVKNTIINAFAQDGNFVTFQDKKIYVQARDGANGEIIQFAITMTMPKTPIAAEANSGDSNDCAFATEVQVSAPTTLSPEDEAKVKELMKNLGIAN